MIPPAAITQASKHLILEGYLLKGENYRIGSDVTLRFGKRLTTVTGDAIAPDCLDRIVTILTRDLVNKDKTQKLRLPSTVFNGVSTRAAFIFDDQLVELTLAEGFLTTML